MAAMSVGGRAQRTHLASLSGRHSLAAEIVWAVIDAGADGLNLDLEELP